MVAFESLWRGISKMPVFLKNYLTLEGGKAIIRNRNKDLSEFERREDGF